MKKIHQKSRRGDPMWSPTFHPNKSRGQNFLIDKNILRKIIAAAELKPTDTVIEIGAGTGVLTAELAKQAGRVVAFEIDKKLIPILRENLQDFKNVEIIEKDIKDIKILKDINIQYPISNYKVVANIPYNITSAVLEKFLFAPRRNDAACRVKKNNTASCVIPCFPKPSLMVLLVQKEVAERICAKPGQMSVLSVMVQYYGQPEIIAIVPASAFWPRPKVESAVLRIEDIKEIKEIKEIEFEQKFFQVVKAGFSHRRKMLKNSLNALNFKIVKNQQLNLPAGQAGNLTIKQFKSESRRLTEDRIVEILKKIGLPPTIRAQELSVEDWRKLTLALLGQRR